MSSKPTHYVVHIGHQTQTKNKLQRDFAEFLKSLEGHLYTAERLSVLKNLILKNAEDLNFRHYRCQPLKIDFDKCYDNTGLVLRGFPFMVFQINKAYWQLPVDNSQN